MGKSLGQVASQTLESMQTINAVTSTSIIRPVVTMDKLEIIDIAQETIPLKFQSSLLKTVVLFLRLTVLRPILR